MKKLYLLALLTLLFLLGACDLQINTSIDSGSVEVGSGSEVGIMKDLWDFNEIYKKSLMQTGKGQIEEANKTTPMTLSKWEGIENSYMGQTVEVFSGTTDLDPKLKQIGDYIRDADSLVKEEKYIEAHEKLELVRKDLRDIREENNIVIISDDMLAFHDIMEEIVDKGEKNSEELQHLKDSLQPLKNYNKENNEYFKLLSDLELVVDQLIGAEGEEYKEVLNTIKPAFIKLYVQFG